MVFAFYSPVNAFDLSPRRSNAARARTLAKPEQLIVRHLGGQAHNAAIQWKNSGELKILEDKRNRSVEKFQLWQATWGFEGELPI